MQGDSLSHCHSVWRANPTPLLSHRFVEGVVLYRASDKTTLYLPHPLARLLDILQCSESGLSEADMANTLIAAGWPADDVPAALEALTSRQLIAAA
jgi:hypothetical protein